MRHLKINLIYQTPNTHTHTQSPALADYIAYTVNKKPNAYN